MVGRHRPWGLPTLPARAAITHGALPGRRDGDIAPYRHYTRAFSPPHPAIPFRPRPVAARTAHVPRVVRTHPPKNLCAPIHPAQKLFVPLCVKTSCSTAMPMAHAARGLHTRYSHAGCRRATARGGSPLRLPASWRAVFWRIPGWNRMRGECRLRNGDCGACIRVGQRKQNRRSTSSNIRREESSEAPFPF